MVRRPPVRIRTQDVCASRLGADSAAIAGVAEDASCLEPDQHDGALAARFAQLQSQLDHLKSQVHQAQQLAGLGAAAATIAHEVNNLLTPIRAYAQAALDADDHKLQRKALSVTLKNADVLVSMTERVLQVGAATSADRQSVSLADAVNAAVESLCRGLDKDGIHFSMSVEAAPVAWADPLHLQQVFFNLFLNARNAMAASHSGNLSVSSKRAGDDVVIDVADNGPGIAAEWLPFIFDSLQSSKTPGDDERKRCSGLGLALCRDIVEEHGGTISVTSTIDVGTTFAITLPADTPSS